MRIRGIVAIGILALAALAPQTQAGQHYNQPVYMGSNYAGGAMNAVRNSADNTQYIGCDAGISGGSPYIACYAQDVNGNTLACSSTNTQLFQIISGLVPGGFIYFTVSSGVCQYVLTEHATYYM